MDTALTHKFPFILDRNLAKANCTENHVCTSCDKVVLGRHTKNFNSKFKIKGFAVDPYMPPRRTGMHNNSGSRALISHLLHNIKRNLQNSKTAQETGFYCFLLCLINVANAVIWYGFYYLNLKLCSGLYVY